MAPTATKEAATAAKTSIEKTFVVVADAIVIRGGEKGHANTLRFTKGTILPESAFAYSDVDRMLAHKAIAPNDGKPKVRTTARDAAKAAGDALDDPALAPNDLSATEDVTADPALRAERDDAPGIEIDGEDEFEVRK